MSEYLLLISPLIFAHLIIPPLSHYQGTEKYNDYLEILYHLQPPEIRSIKDVENLMYNESLPLFSIQTITHMFIHANSRHLFNNLKGLLYGGYPVYKELGIGGLVATFFIGGVSACVPTSLYKISRDSQMERLTEQLLPISSIVPKSVLSWVDKPLKEVAKGVGDVYFKNKLSCGSSGGVCAVIGCDFILVIRDAYKLITKAFKSNNNNSNNDNNNNHRRGSNMSTNDDRLTNNEKYQLFQYGICTFQTISYLSKELNMVYGGDIFDSINHAAHIQGSLAGIAFGLVFGIALPYVQRRRYITL